MSLRVAVVYGSTDGNTARVASTVQRLLQERFVLQVDLGDVRQTDLAALPGYDLVLLGSSTWNWGDLQDDWSTALAPFAALDLQGVPIGFFGCGDGYCYSETFGDALGILWEAAERAGAKLVGQVPAVGYAFSESRAVLDGQLIGVVLDEDNEPELTAERLERWLGALAHDLNLSALA